MKYVILIHSHPQPWGHPTADFLPEQQALPAAERERGAAAWEQLMEEISASGELVGAEALGDPAASRLLRWDGAPVITDGPYSETKEHLAGFFVIDVADAARAEQIANAFCGPGEVIELRPLY